MEVVLLGTGAAAPTLRRWPTSTAILYENEIILFDCGEGIQVQFLKAKLKPGKLSHIFISHLHGDHINGLVGLLTTLQLGRREKKVRLHGPQGLKDYIHFMQKLSHFQLEYPLSVHEIEPDRQQTVWSSAAFQVTAMPLAHRIFSLGFRFKENDKPGKFDAEKAAQMNIPKGSERSRLQSGRPIKAKDGTMIRPEEVIGPEKPGRVVAICADTAPCKNAKQLAQNADLLVHEATFASQDEDMASATGHSTALQAAEVAKAAGVKKLALTHLSARYDHEQEIDLLNNAKKIFNETIIGEDLMRFII